VILYGLYVDNHKISPWSTFEIYDHKISHHLLGELKHQMLRNGWKFVIWVIKYLQLTSPIFSPIGDIFINDWFHWWL